MDEDRALVAALLSGDGDAIHTVRSWVRSALGRYGGALQLDADDVEQEVLLQLIQALEAGQFRYESRLETYVHSSVRFRCIDRLRLLGRRQVVEIDQNVLTSPSLMGDSGLIERRTEDRDLALKVAAEMPEACRRLWEMVGIGLSYSEMSELMGLSEGAIRVRVHRCRQRALVLRRRLLGDDL